MKNTFFHFRKLFTTSFIVFGLISCVQDDDYSIPNIPCQTFTPTLTVQGLKDLATTSAYQMTNDDIVEGYVVSSDERGNFFKEISVVSEDGTRGFEINLDETDTYTWLPIGRKVYVKTKNLWIGKPNTMVEVGGEYGGGVGRLAAVLRKYHIIPGCDYKSEEDLVQKESSPGVPLTITDVTSGENYLNTLIELDNVQFKAQFLNKKLFDPLNTSGTATNNIIEDVNGNELVVRVSQFADFSNNTVPSGNGKIRGVLTRFGTTYQLMIRKFEDIQFTNPRQLWGFASSVSGTPNTIAQVRALQSSSPVTLGNISIEGVVTMSPVSGGNNDSRNAFIQDNTGAIQIRFNTAGHSLVEGFRIKVNLNGMTLSRFNGLLQISNIVQSTQVQVLSINDPIPAPTDLTFADLTNDDHESKLIRIANTQFKNPTNIYSGVRDLWLCDASTLVKVNTRNTAIFANQLLPQGKGNFVGILGKNNGVELLVVKSEDLAGMTGTRCPQPVTLFQDSFATGFGSNWTTQNIIGAQVWIHNTTNGNPSPCLSMNGFSSGAQNNEDWLISKPITLTGYSNYTLNFETDVRFIGPALQVLISTNYTSGDPNLATWNTLSATLDTNTAANTWTSSGNVNLNAYSGQTIRIAFKYTSTTGTNTAAFWLVDNVLLEGL